MKPIQIKSGRLFNGDVIESLHNVDNESVDMIFADPPFNLSKDYNDKVDDNLEKEEYLMWCQLWISTSVPKLKEGGSFFLWNIPKWNTYLSTFLNDHLTFRNWISVNFKANMPIRGRLYPSHYSLLYYIKGDKPRSFNPDRLEMEICNNCYEELKDYGGYKSKLNSEGISLSDVWNDIYPVRHKRYKFREANELPIKLLDRIIELSTNQGDEILDLFSGSGSALVTAELKRRKWIGIEIGDTEIITKRFENIEKDFENLQNLRNSYNKLFSDKTRKERLKNGIWVNEDHSR